MDYIPKWTDADTIGNSVIVESSSKIGIGTATPAEKLDVNGNIMTTGASTNTGYDRYLKLYGNTQPASNPHRWAGMAVYNNGGNNVNALAFFTGTGDSARTEKVRIHNDVAMVALINSSSRVTARSESGLVRQAES